jgi:tRNA(fMet)-specific endonuclease VapC
MTGGRRFMLDTNAVSRIIRDPSPEREARLQAVPPADLCISAITEGELRFGLARRPAARRLAEVVEAFLARVDILPWDSVAAARYGELRAGLETQGTPLADLDTLIAAHALAAEAVLVTADKAFGRVPDLTVEDWETV